MATNNAINLGKYTFSAYLSGDVANTTGAGTVYQVICDTPTVNEGSCYNATTGDWTAPCDGNFFFGFICAFGNIQVNHTTGQVKIQKNLSPAVNCFYMNPVTSASGGYVGFTANTLYTLAKNDIVTFKLVVTGGSDVIILHGDAFANWTTVFGYQVL